MTIVLATSASAQNETSSIEVPLAVVEGIEINEDDISAILESRRRVFGDDPVEARRRALETLVAETAIEAESREEGVVVAPEVEAALLDARRQVLFQYYVQSRFQPERPTPEEVDAYIEENGHLFDERVEYRFFRFTATPRNATDRRRVEDVLQRIDTSTDVDESFIDARLFELAVQDVPFSRQLFWNPSEALGEDMRDRLETMRSEDRRLDTVERGGVIDAVYLLDARPAPVDPALLRSQIADRLVQEQFQAHRTAIIEEIAAPYLESPLPTDVDVEDVPPERQAVAPGSGGIAARLMGRFDREDFAVGGVGVLGFGVILTIVSGAFWIRAARDLRLNFEERGYGATSVLPVDREAVAISGSALAAILLIAASVLAAWSLPWATRPAQLSVLAAGGALMGALSGVILARARPIDQARPVVYGRALLGGCALLVIAALLVLN